MGKDRYIVYLRDFIQNRFGIRERENAIVKLTSNWLDQLIMAPYREHYGQIEFAQWDEHMANFYCNVSPMLVCLLPYQQTDSPMHDCVHLTKSQSVDERYTVPHAFIMKSMMEYAKKYNLNAEEIIRYAVAVGCARMDASGQYYDGDGIVGEPELSDGLDNFYYFTGATDLYLRHNFVIDDGTDQSAYIPFEYYLTFTNLPKGIRHDLWWRAMPVILVKCNVAWPRTGNTYTLNPSTGSPSLSSFNTTVLNSRIIDTISNSMRAMSQYSAFHKGEEE